MRVRVSARTSLVLRLLRIRAMLHPRVATPATRDLATKLFFASLKGPHLSELPDGVSNIPNFELRRKPCASG